MKGTVTGKQCQCTACHRTFSTEANFDKHRRGSYTEGRYCVDPESLGMQKKDGVWRMKPNPEYNRGQN
jgi:NAD-dependent SIR2 family protein deacetylase